MEQLQKFTIYGNTPEERGIMYGTKCKNLINNILSQYKRFFNDGHVGISWDEARRESKKFIPYINEYSPELLEEIYGIAKGSESNFEDILVLNSRSEIMTLVKKYKSDEEEIDGCSSAVVLTEASSDGHVIFGQNWDTYSWQGYGSIVLEVISDEGPDLMLLTEAGQLARYGFNQAGIALGVNSLHKTYNTEVFGVPSTFIRRKFLHQDRWVDATNTIFKAKSMIPMYYIGAFAGGDAMGFEMLNEGIMVLYPENGLIVHSNHIVHKGYSYQRESLGGTLYRNRRIERKLRPIVGSIAKEDIIDSFKDHFGYPFAVCRHGDPRKKEMDRISTLACLVIDVTEKQMWACKGTPCEGEFTEFKWTRPERAADWENIVMW